jgi:hypothetical protein
MPRARRESFEFRDLAIKARRISDCEAGSLAPERVGGFGRERAVDAQADPAVHRRFEASGTWGNATEPEALLGDVPSGQEVPSDRILNCGGRLSQLWRVLIEGIF